MTRANQWLVVGGVLSVGAGFLGGMMFAKRDTPAGVEPFGRIYRVRDDVFVDQAALEYLKARADETVLDGTETRLRFFNQWVHLKWRHDAAIFPGQRGSIYTLRQVHGDTREARGDREAWRIIQSLTKFGLLENGGGWSDWNDLARTNDSVATRRERRG